MNERQAICKEILSWIDLDKGVSEEMVDRIVLSKNTRKWLTVEERVLFSHLMLDAKNIRNYDSYSSDSPYTWKSKEHRENKIKEYNSSLKQIELIFFPTKD